MTLVLSPRKARILEALLNMSAVRGAPMDPDCMNAEEMAIENLIGKGMDKEAEELREVIRDIWETLYRKNRR